MMAQMGLDDDNDHDDTSKSSDHEKPWSNDA